MKERRLDALIGDHLSDFLIRLARLGAQSGIPLALVGGAVRDAFLKRPLTELDFVTTAELVDVLTVLKANWQEFYSNFSAPTRIVQFPRYRTAKLLFSTPVLPGISALDFSSARREQYSEPGSRPETFPGTLEEDMLRRDFSINALALKPEIDGGYSILDIVHGLEDLDAKVLRILHSKSFLDDPMRIVRAARFVVRFEFALDPGTQLLLEEAVDTKVIDRVFAQRRGAELVKALQERSWYRVLTTLTTWGALPQLLPLSSEGPVFSESDNWSERFLALYGGDRERAERSARLLELRLKL